MIFEDTTLWLVALTAVLLWLPQNVTHEGAHALAAKLFGATITEFWPFPGTRRGYFSFAYIRWRNARPLQRWERALVSAAPQLLNTLVLLVLVSTSLSLALSPFVASVLGALALVHFVDGAVNLGTFYYPTARIGTDGWTWSAELGLGPWGARLLAASWHLGFGFFLLIPSSFYT